jgi:RNA polymerase sigma-B factor
MGQEKKQAPDRNEVDALIRDYRRTKDTLTRDRLIAQHLYLVQTAARKFTGLGESHDDLLQEGAMGLINAVDLYDPDRGVQFSTYATHLVEGQIRHYLRDRGKLIKQPAWVQELTTKIIKASEALTQKLNRAPTPEEVSELVGATPESVRRMLEARERSKVASLDAARGEEDEQGPAIDPEKLRIEDPDGLHLPVEDRIFLREAMSRLKTLERRVVHNFYYLDLNQTEIARKLGISVNYASYLLRGAVAKLKKAFEAQEQAATADGAGRHGALPNNNNTPSAYSLSARPAPLDPITKLATEGYLAERLEQEVSRASRYPQQFALVLIELDPHDIDAAGLPPAEADSASPHPERSRGAAAASAKLRFPPQKLVDLARLLRSNCRSIDLVARISGARFGLLLPHTGREASVLSERICRMASARLSTEADPLTVSSGFAVFPTNGCSTEDLFAAAQRALADAKQQGGNCSVRADPVRRAKGQAQPATG